MGKRQLARAGIAATLANKFTRGTHKPTRKITREDALAPA